MEIKISKERIEFEKELSTLDKFVINFTSILNDLDIKYVVVSGYVAILFGRNRTSEDVDIIIEKTTFDKFEELWNEVHNEFECQNTENLKNAYAEYLSTDHAIRFSKKARVIPNIELKFPKDRLELWAISNRKEVVVNGHKMFISQLELQIPFKIFLGSEKDIEDARYLYAIFREWLDRPLMQEFCQKLKIQKTFNKYIGRR